MKNCGALDYTKTKLQELVEEAKEELRKADFEESSFKFFDGFADFVIKRDV